MSEPTIQELFDLTGRVALITGGTGFLGSSMSRGLAEAGANVVIASRDLARATSAAEALPRQGDQKHFGVQLDHLDEDSLNSGFDSAVAAAGQVDILINNGQQGHAMDVTDVTFEAFSKDLQNASGYFCLARRLRDHTVSRGVAGSVVMIGSMYGVVGSYPDAYEEICTASPVQYHALKGGVIHMTRHLAVYWAKDNVRVNCLSPGPFPSEKAPQEMVERLKKKSPMQRMGHPHELKGALLLMVSDAGSYLTGQNLLIDGGWTAW
ncbi:SDR family oxidoreductase [Thalassoglobus polymorphus]|uniref:Glucose 1-dehydrogenase 2 n=1 Tax=Thalassoglobus polymorphus TaxID=2527994 RepID=A0A517QV15_9PLAN|nr:SDR family oxidoreductase [Thalassoglobus polymorphus]QDT35479.1 Glucose 1-dehydrogenase 2 [Thalassoglobus polymorphus]